MINMETTDEKSKKYNITPKKIWIHLSTIMKHKFWVFYFCNMCGFTWKGIVHDLSKFSPTEFWTNVKYVIPGKSPIDVQKEEIGFSMAWQHHKGHNPHHYEFWMDKFDDGCYVTKMPFEYAVEMLCDNLAAGKAYQGKKFTYESELKWWEKQRKIRNMHPDNRDFLDVMFHKLYEYEQDLKAGEKVKLHDILNKYHLLSVYLDTVSGKPQQMKILDGNTSKDEW